MAPATLYPEAWGKPPVLTLIALGKRLAKHLAGPEYEDREAARARDATKDLLPQR